MTDIVERLMSAVSLAAGRSSDERAMMNEAADEIVRLRGELENVQRDRMAQVDNERLRELIKEWAEADSANDFMANDTAAIRYARAMEALRQEANR